LRMIFGSMESYLSGLADVYVGIEDYLRAFGEPGENPNNVSFLNLII